MSNPQAALTRFGAPPTAEDIVELAEQALTAMPAKLRRVVRGVAILVEETPDDETLAELGIENAWDLTGLYRGVPIGEKGSAATPHEPDMVLLYREPILLEWIETGEELFNLVRTVLIHEIAHHFGFNDADIEDLEKE
ncbi:MAG: metallopeptidase family protein [Acetobacteraceae bacterium]|nr:metallopeptidase family protein [Acetobacteraceae bacterium]